VAPTTILEDATVPRSELARMIRFVEATAKKHRLRIGTFGHMGDGNLHPTFLTDERNTDEMRRVHEAFREIFDEAIRLGGTITGEHGIGRGADARHARVAPVTRSQWDSEPRQDVRVTPFPPLSLTPGTCPAKVRSCSTTEFPFLLP
jgi:FAD/FMN-containing dehydrogenase